MSTDTFAGSLSLDDGDLSESQVAMEGERKDSEQQCTEAAIDCELCDAGGVNGLSVERKEQVTVLVEPVEDDSYYQTR
jgi:hypothetical protein